MYIDKLSRLRSEIKDVNSLMYDDDFAGMNYQMRIATVRYFHELIQEVNEIKIETQTVIEEPDEDAELENWFDYMFEDATPKEKQEARKDI